MRTIFLVFSLCLIGCFSLDAQTIIKGKAVDSSSRMAIPFASVSLFSLPDSGRVKGAMADSVGYFELTGIKTGHYVLSLSSQEHRPLTREVIVPSPASDVDLGGIGLLRQQRLLQEVVVRGEKRAIQYRDDRVVLQVAGNSFFKTSANVTDMLGKAPGVTVNGDGTLLVSGRNAPVIFIDGKPTAMSAEEQQAYLNGLSPEMVESIEIIHTPGAQYDAQYKAIIDIRLKKEGLGWKGMLNSSFRQHVYGFSDNNLQLSLGTRRFTYGLRAGYVAGTDYHLYQALQQQANTNYMATRTYNRTRNDNLSVQLNVDYQLSKNQSLGLWWKTYQSDRARQSLNTLVFSDSAWKYIGTTQSVTLADPLQRNNAFNISYDAVWGKNRLSVFGNVTQTKNRQQEDIQNRNQETDDLMNYWKTALKNDILLRTAQVDYSRSISKGTLEAGARFAFITTDNDLKYDTLAKDNSFVRDAGRTNRFLYDEYISAAYLGYNQALKKFSFKLSLRTEHTYTVANAFTQEVTKRNYLTWLPGAQFSYSISDHQQVSFSFTRRMTRPNFGALNPFRFYLSPLNYWVGNPFLQPSVTSLLSLVYNYKSLMITVSAGKEEDVMTRYPEYNPVTNELQYLGRNLPYNNFARVELGYSFSLTKWWKTNHNLGVYYNKELTPYHGVEYAIGITDYSINGSHVFTLPRGIVADLSYMYKSKTGNGLYYIEPLGSVDIGLQKNWWQGKLNTRFNFYDLFNTFIRRLDFRQKSIINNRLSHRFYLKRAVVTIAYSFGKAKRNPKQNKTTEEEGRLGN